MLERDTVTGLNLAVYREENPTTGRWDNQDPLRFKAGDSNLYRFVSNEPTGYSDQSGLQSVFSEAPRLTGFLTFEGIPHQWPRVSTNRRWRHERIVRPAWRRTIRAQCAKCQP